jgi:hypothetical protein
MKKLIILLALFQAYPVFCQENKLSGIYTEYKRTLWNNEDGSKYTIDRMPFAPKLQFDFNNNNSSVTVYDGSIKSENSYVINDDTLIFAMQLGKGQNIRTLYTKYIILENKNELVLRDFKPNLDKSYYLKKYYFKKNGQIQQEYLSKNNYEIFTIVEESPSFPGGVEEMKKFIAEEVSKSNIKGNEKVFLKLLISPEGKILTVDYLNTPKVEYIEEAVKIVRKFPDFVPGKQSGKPVYVYYNLPVKFDK